MQGVGLHTGESCRVTIRSAEPGQGIRFRKVDGKGKEGWIPVSLSSVRRTRRATTLGHGPHDVGTVEHLLSAAAGLGIRDAVIEVEGPEIPILDGSARPWVDGFLRLGLCGDPEWVPWPKTVELRQGNTLVRIEPSDSLRMDVEVEFDETILGRQAMTWVYDRRSFIEDIAPARTLGRLSEIEGLRRSGLIRGGSLGCALVVSDTEILNPEGARFPDEPVRHRVLDALGDLLLWSAPALPRARVTITKAGHAHLIAALKRAR